MRLLLAGGPTEVDTIVVRAKVNSEGGAIVVQAVDKVTIKGAGTASSEETGAQV